MLLVQLQYMRKILFKYYANLSPNNNRSGIEEWFIQIEENYTRRPDHIHVSEYPKSDCVFRAATNLIITCHLNNSNQGQAHTLRDMQLQQTAVSSITASFLYIPLNIKIWVL